jgi:hypothetical protein
MFCSRILQLAAEVKTMLQDGASAEPGRSMKLKDAKSPAGHLSEVNQNLRNHKRHSIRIAAIINYMVKDRKRQKRNADHAHHENIVTGGLLTPCE